MAFNGSGTFNREVSDYTFNAVIDEADHNTEHDSFATGLTNCITKDGQTTVTANIPMNSKKFTGLTAGSAAGDSATLGQIQAEAYVWGGTAGGTADALTLTPSPAITAYAAGQRFRFIAGASPNTGAATVAVSGLTTKAIQNNGNALVANEITAGEMFEITYDGTQFQLSQVWVSPGAPVVGKVRDFGASGEAWSNFLRYEAVTADPTVVAADQRKFYECSSSNFNISTAAPSVLGAGHVFFVRHEGGIGNTYTITGDGVATFRENGATSIALTAPGETVGVMSDGTNFLLICDLRFVGFEAYDGSSTSVVTTTDTKITCDTEEADPQSHYDAATNFRYTPKRAGDYLVWGMLEPQVAMTAGKLVRVKLFKNGSDAGTRYRGALVVPTGGGGQTAVFTGVITMNGSTDYLELYGWHDDTVNRVCFGRFGARLLR